MPAKTWFCCGVNKILSLLSRAFSRARVLSLPCLSRSLSRLVSAGPLSLPALPSRIARLATRPFSARPHKTRCKTPKRKTPTACTLDTLRKHTLFKQTLTLLLPPLPSLFFFAVHCSRFPLPCKLSSYYSRPHCAASRRAWAPQSKLLLCHDTYHHTQKRDRSENSHIERAARRRRFDSMTTATQRTSNRHAE